MPEKIFLIGMPGSGKSTFGKDLAEALGYILIELDNEVEAKMGMSISEAFNKKGEPYFRQVEKEVLRNLALANQVFVMSTGGGTPIYHNGLEFMNEHGVTIFLDVSLETLQGRLTKTDIATRPKFGSAEEMSAKLGSLYEERLAIYQKAHVSISEGGIDVSNVIRELESFRK